MNSIYFDAVANWDTYLEGISMADDMNTVVGFIGVV